MDQAATNDNDASAIASEHDDALQVVLKEELDR
jgi:hypothetical protein